MEEMRKFDELLQKMIYKIFAASKIALKIGICLSILLAIFVHFYSYSMLTRIVYSFDWFLAKTPLMSLRTGEVYIPPILSKIFHWLHSLKIFILALATLFYNDGYPYFDGKYHWTRKELEFCKVNEDTLFNGQFAKDPRLQCHIYAIIPLMFVKVELFSAEPPILKFHQFLPSKRIQTILNELEKRKLFTSQILVRDGLGQNIWQDSIVANNTFIHPFSTQQLMSTFIFIQQRINSFNFGRSEQFNVKKYEIGGHYAPHLDFLVANSEPWLGNRIATFMLILQPAKRGGGTVFPDVGFTFMPKMGDALLWLNMLPDYSVAYRSFHGACPILEGTKIGVTMWIRSVTQELRLPSPLQFGQHFDYKLLIQPKMKKFKLWE